MYIKLISIIKLFNTNNPYEIIDNLITIVVTRLSLEFNKPEILAYYANIRLKVIEPKKFNKKNIFALSHFRFRGELEMLSRNGFKIYVLNPFFFSTIQNFFYKRYLLHLIYYSF